jgi:four helix bundle protein
MHNFKELKIWQKSMDLAASIYKMLSEYPDFEKYGLISQVRRCSVSIPSNIAEGSGRDSTKDFSRFLGIALSSAFELETQLILSNKLGFISDEKFEKYSAETRELQKMIFGFKKSLKETTKTKNIFLSIFY